MSGPTLAGVLERAWRRWPSQVALQAADVILTYAEMEAQVSALAAGYRRLGIGPGDRVACALSNRPEHLVAAAAAWMCGAVHVGLDHQLTGRELTWLVGHLGARILLCEPAGGSDPLGPARAVRAENPATLVAVAGQAAEQGFVPLAEVVSATAPGLAPHEPCSPRAPGGDDAAVILVTSGTTGRPKTPLGFHGPLAEAWGWLAGELGFAPDDVHLAQLPLSHGFGLSMAVMALATGGRLVLQGRFSPEDALGTVTTEAVTVLNGTPAHFILLADRFDPTRHDLASLRAGVGTASVFPPAVLRWIVEDLGMRFMLMYGSSEGLSVTTTDRDDILAGSVGRPEPGTVAVLGPDGRPLGAGQVGEIAFRRGLWPVRYWGGGPGGPGGGGDADSAGDGDGAGDWYHTGDLGRLDADGRLFVLGRLKHQIDRGGLKVDPGEVEQLLLGCPGVADAAVMGIPDPVMGEVVCACVVPAAGWAPELGHIRAHLAGVLAPYKLPERLHLVASLPRTPIGKVDRARLGADLAAAAPVPPAAEADR